jgi:serine/threonine protein kinase
MTGGTTGSLAPGTLLDGKYDIVALLGAGGMGEVYKARHVHLGAYRCIKVMKTSLMSDEVYRQRFLREARLATQLHHPNVAVVHDFSILGDGTSYMVTEYIDGTTVRQWEGANGRFPLALAIEVTQQVLAGLDYIHRRNLLHRDVSADNVMLAFDPDEHLVAKIIDLGIAKDVTNVSASPVATTQNGMFVGNPKYMSPEQLGELEEGEAVDARSDLYSLGVVLYEMLAGVPPFNARTTNGFIVKHLTEPPRTFQEANPGLALPPGLEEVVLRALEKKRERRWQTARELAAALAAFAPRHVFTRAELTPTPEADQAWAFATAADSYTAIRDYRASFPNHRFDEADRLLRERLAWETAAAIDTEDAWSTYLEQWPEDRHAAAARERLEAARVREETAYSVTMESKSAAMWRAYLDEFPDSSRSADAEVHLREALAYEEARAADDIGALGLFLLNFPNGLREYDARARLEWLEGAAERRRLARMAIIEGDFNAAFEAGTVEAWDAWLATYSGTPQAAEARRCREEAEQYELAASVGTKVMWRAFLKAWPNGRHRLDAELRSRD